MVCIPSIDRFGATAGPDTVNATRTLAAGEILFQTGDTKDGVYRVESGVICVYEPCWTGERTIVDFAFSGDIVGLGFLDTHAVTARALVESHVACLSASAAKDIVAKDPRAEARLADAIERELDARRDQLSDAGRMRPVERIAALLVNLSCSNRYEGHDPSLITDSWDCGTIADMLDLGVEELAATLVELEKRGLVKTEPLAGLRLKNIAALEALADGLSNVTGICVGAKPLRPPKLPYFSAAA